jgi:hypothetical protein
MKLTCNSLGYAEDFDVLLTNTRKTTGTVLNLLSRMACGIYLEGNTNVKTLELDSLRPV